MLNIIYNCLFGRYARKKREIIMNITQSTYSKITLSWWLLKITYGLLFIVAGADKFFNLITDWHKYISPLVINHSPVSASIIIILVGILEIAIGVLTLSNRPKLGAFLGILWLIVIVANLLTFRIYYDIAVRDIVMAIGALVFAILTSAIEDLRSNQQ